MIPNRTIIDALNKNNFDYTDFLMNLKQSSNLLPVLDNDKYIDLAELLMNRDPNFSENMNIHELLNLTKKIEYYSKILVKTITKRYLENSQIFNKKENMELIKKIGKKNGVILKYMYRNEILVPRDILQEILLDCDKKYFRYIPFQTDKIKSIILSRDGMHLKNIIKPTLADCLIAIRENNKSIKYVPEKYSDHDKIKKCISKNTKLLNTSSLDWYYDN